MTVRSENTISKKDIVNSIKLDVGTSSKNIHKITDEIIDIISEILKNEKKNYIEKSWHFSFET